MRGSPFINVSLADPHHSSPPVALLAHAMPEVDIAFLRLLPAALFLVQESLESCIRVSGYALHFCTSIIVAQHHTVESFVVQRTTCQFFPDGRLDSVEVFRHLQVQPRSSFERYLRDYRGHLQRGARSKSVKIKVKLAALAPGRSSRGLL